MSTRYDDLGIDRKVGSDVSLSVAAPLFAVDAVNISSLPGDNVQINLTLTGNKQKLQTLLQTMLQQLTPPQQLVASRLAAAPAQALASATTLATAPASVPGTAPRYATPYARPMVHQYHRNAPHSIAAGAGVPSMADIKMGLDLPIQPLFVVANNKQLTLDPSKDAKALAEATNPTYVRIFGNVNGAMAAMGYPVIPGANFTSSKDMINNLNLGRINYNPNHLVLFWELAPNSRTDDASTVENHINFISSQFPKLERLTVVLLKPTNYPSPVATVLQGNFSDALTSRFGSDSNIIKGLITDLNGVVRTGVNVSVKTLQDLNGILNPPAHLGLAAANAARPAP